ncbi:MULTISPECIES: hypothetical protein [unclassified Moorena]|nr:MULTISPECIES: hypothetical protein [unclassified Moorena]NEQ16277.1 hypothetical protein [Moorena sp. SIO3E2]NES42568.1 hypothetical protein [Moorena sp. SIO2C4]
MVSKAKSYQDNVSYQLSACRVSAISHSRSVANGQGQRLNAYLSAFE